MEKIDFKISDISSEEPDTQERSFFEQIMDIRFPFCFSNYSIREQYNAKGNQRRPLNLTTSNAAPRRLVDPFVMQYFLILWFPATDIVPNTPIPISTYPV